MCPLVILKSEVSMGDEGKCLFIKHENIANASLRVGSEEMGTVSTDQILREILLKCSAYL